MDYEQVEFRAGRDAYGQALWVAGAVVDQEQRDDGTWLYVLPAGSESAEEGRWTRPDELRRLRSGLGL